MCENKDFCGVEMPSEDTNILEFNQYRTSDKAPSIIYPDIDSLIKRADRCKNNSQILSSTNGDDHIPCGYSVSRM